MRRLVNLVEWMGYMLEGQKQQQEEHEEEAAAAGDCEKGGWLQGLRCTYRESG